MDTIMTEVQMPQDDGLEKLKSGQFFDEDMPLEPTRQPSVTPSTSSKSSDDTFEDVVRKPKRPKEPLYYACSKCYRSFKDINSLRDHLQKSHGICPGDRTEHAGDNTFLTIGKKSLELSLMPHLGERHLNVLSSKIHGKGLFSGGFIAKGEIIIEYIGETINRNCAIRRQHLYDIHKHEHYIMKVGKIIIDATILGNCSKYINNSCDPNCTAELIDILGKNRVLIMSTRNILAGEELTYDYQFTSDELIPCNCRAVKCRRFLNCNLEKLKLDEANINSLIKSLD